MFLALKSPIVVSSNPLTYEVDNLRRMEEAGAGAVDKYGGIPPYDTTQLYVRMVLKQYYKFKAKAAASPDRP